MHIQVAIRAKLQHSRKTATVQLKDVHQGDNPRVLKAFVYAKLPGGVFHIAGFLGIRPVGVQLMDFDSHFAHLLHIKCLQVSQGLLFPDEATSYVVQSAALHDTLQHIQIPDASIIDMDATLIQYDMALDLRDFKLDKIRCQGPKSGWLAYLLLHASGLN